MDRADQQKLLLLGVACGALIVLTTNKVSRSKAQKVATSGTTIPIYTPPATSPKPSPAPTPTPKPPATSSSPATKTKAQLVELTIKAIYAEIPLRRWSPRATRTLAEAMVQQCAEQSYPLDLAFGHIYTESSCQIDAYNRSSGAHGPMQVTPIAAKQVGVAYPFGAATGVKAGILYMKWLRSTYPECSGSVKTCLQHYGMGRGNWLDYKRNGCGAKPCSSSKSVVRAECGCATTRQYSALIVTMAKRHPELKTVSWWGS